MEVEEKVGPKAKSQLSEKISINGLSVVRGNELWFGEGEPAVPLQTQA
jgi:hypothetical protein